MNKGRLEAFSDGVIAIIITIMVLELKVPHGAELSVLRPLLPVFLSYALSFVNSRLPYAASPAPLSRCVATTARDSPRPGRYPIAPVYPFSDGFCTSHPCETMMPWAK